VVFRERKASSTPKFGQVTTTWTTLCCSAASHDADTMNRSSQAFRISGISPEAPISVLCLASFFRHTPFPVHHTQSTPSLVGPRTQVKAPNVHLSSHESMSARPGRPARGENARLSSPLNVLII
jgi:hypothetical protein